MDKYDLPHDIKIQTIQEQIAECQRIIYRNYLENLSFTANNEKNRMKEVEANNETLKEKLDLLWEEHDKVSNETSGNTAK